MQRKIKIRLLVLSIFIFLLGLSVYLYKDIFLTAFWKTYKNDVYGFQIRYPKDWQVSNFSQDGLVNIVFIQPLLEGERLRRPVVQLNIESNENNEDLKTFLGSIGYGVDSPSKIKIGKEPGLFFGSTDAGKYVSVQHDQYVFIFKAELISQQDQQVLDRMLTTLKFTR